MGLILNRLRLFTGLHWRGKFPPIPWRDLLALAAILLIYGVMGYSDGLADRAAEMERRAVMAERAAEIYSAKAAVLSRMQM